jgi:alkylation response protein AidB-like acyl-CoA dehydrogenase
MWCTFADGADYLTVLARTEPVTDYRHRHRGISQFFIEKERGTLPPGCTGTPVNKIGYHGWKTWELHFDGTEAIRISDPGRGFYNAVSGLETARAHTAARAIGLSRGALEDSIAYAKQRQQFGRPIAEFQAIRFKLAQMAAEIEAARQLNYFVCTELDSRRRCDKEAGMAKWFASEMAERVTSEALQIHGGYGYTTDLPIERYWRDPAGGLRPAPATANAQPACASAGSAAPRGRSGRSPRLRSTADAWRRQGAGPRQ